MGEDHTEPDQQESTEPIEPTEGGQPATDEPPVEPARPSRAKLVATICFLVVAVAAAVYSGVRTMRQQQRREAATAPVVMAEPMAPPEPIGSEDAKLKIEVCLGHCISAMFQPFVECAEAWPDKVRAEFYAYESKGGRSSFRRTARRWRACSSTARISSRWRTAESPGKCTSTARPETRIGYRTLGAF